LPVEALSAVLVKKPNVLILVEKPEKEKVIGPTIVLASNTHLSAPPKGPHLRACGLL
jgi:hypothetical protein